MRLVLGHVGLVLVMWDWSWVMWDGCDLDGVTWTDGPGRV